jgi:hypothetical protein
LFLRTHNMFERRPKFKASRPCATSTRPIIKTSV